MFVDSTFYNWMWLILDWNNFALKTDWDIYLMNKNDINTITNLNFMICMRNYKVCYKQ